MSSAVYYDDPKPLPPLTQLMQAPQSDMFEPVQLALTSPEVFSQPNSQPSSTHTTPASSFSGASGGPTSLSNHYQVTSGVQTDKCTCKAPQNRIPRPRNAFILFRQKYHQAVLDEDSLVRTNPEVSRELGRRWRNLSAKDKEHWTRLAEEEKINHAKRYPGYRYTPRRNGKKGGCPACRQKQMRQHLVPQYQQPSYPPMPEYGYAQSIPYVQQQQIPQLQQPQQLQQQQLQHPHYANYMAPMPAYAAAPSASGLSGMPMMVPQFQPFGFNSEVPVNSSISNQEKLSPLSSAVSGPGQIPSFPQANDMNSGSFQYDSAHSGSAAGSGANNLQLGVMPNTGSVNVNLGSNPPRFNSLPTNISNYAFEVMMPLQP